MASLPKDAAAQTRRHPEAVRRPEGWAAKAIVAALVALGAVAAAWLLLRLFPVILVFVGALFLVGTLNPIVRWGEARGVKRNVAVGIVFAALFVVALGLFV